MNKKQIVKVIQKEIKQWQPNTAIGEEEHKEYFDGYIQGGIDALYGVLPKLVGSKYYWKRILKKN